jgi:hypothetical protein
MLVYGSIQTLTRLRYYRSMTMEINDSAGRHDVRQMSEAMDLKNGKNFFETRVTEYQTGSALTW